MNCWNCGTTLVDLPLKLSFRATCDHCHAWLHCCKNCKNYMPGKPNDCFIPGTDAISDRTAANLCEEYIAKGTGPEQPKISPEDIAKRLFKD